MPWLMFSRGSRPLCAGLVACYWGANPRGPGDQPWHIGNEVPLPMTLKESGEGTKKVNLIFLQLRPEMPVINGEKQCYKRGYHSLNEIVTDL